MKRNIFFTFSILILSFFLSLGLQTNSITGYAVGMYSIGNNDFDFFRAVLTGIIAYLGLIFFYSFNNT